MSKRNVKQRMFHEKEPDMCRLRPICGTESPSEGQLHGPGGGEWRGAGDGGLTQRPAGRRKGALAAGAGLRVAKGPRSLRKARLGGRVGSRRQLRGLSGSARTPRPPPRRCLVRGR